MKWFGLLGISLTMGLVAACSDNVGGGGGEGGGSGGASPFSSSSGFGQDDCEKATAHVEACFPQDTTSSGTGATLECTGPIQCQALCVSAASCDTLVGNDVNGQVAYTDCLVDCQG